MSFYTKFQDAEPSITSTTTGGILKSTDPVLVFSGARSTPGQSTAGSISCQGFIGTAATTLTTGTNISNFGVTTITATSTSIVTPNWILADPLAAGVCKTLINLTSTTSTGLTISFASATLVTTNVTSGGGTQMQLGAYGAYIELQALSTAQWAMIGRSAAGANSS